VQAAARALGQPIAVVEVRNKDDLDHVFASVVLIRANALFVSGDPVFTDARTQLTALAAKYAIPASYSFRDLAVAGGLDKLRSQSSRRASPSGRVYRPIVKSCRSCSRPSSDLVINLKTAKALGIAVPRSLLLRADEVIQ
jgi:putative ABC transport system substrate-binding protein